jgi:hypothetical protein
MMQLVGYSIALREEQQQKAEHCLGQLGEKSETKE